MSYKTLIVIGIVLLLLAFYVKYKTGAETISPSDVYTYLANISSGGKVA